jgi:hypothetical protein
MSLRQLIYVSTAVQQPMSAAEIEALGAASAARNISRGVGGLLVHDARYFVQVLEGPVATINRLYLRIAQDPRHTRVELLSYHAIERPQYADWSMRALELAGSDWHPISGARDDEGNFDPYALDPLGTHMLLGRTRTRHVLISNT